MDREVSFSFKLPLIGFLNVTGSTHLQWTLGIKHFILSIYLRHLFTLSAFIWQSNFVFMIHRLLFFHRVIRYQIHYHFCEKANPSLFLPDYFFSGCQKCHKGSEIRNRLGTWKNSSLVKQDYMYMYVTHWFCSSTVFLVID